MIDRDDMILAERLLYKIDDALDIIDGSMVPDEIVREVVELERIRDRLLDVLGWE
jgi:hypothetical protein